MTENIYDKLNPTDQWVVDTNIDQIKRIFERNSRESVDVICLISDLDGHYSLDISSDVSARQIEKILKNDLRLVKKRIKQDERVTKAQKKLKKKVKKKEK